MAIDPDVDDLLIITNARLDALESGGPGDGAHTHQGSNGGPLVDVGIRYVTEGGDDSSDGLSWATALASPQVAYDALVAHFDVEGLTAIKGRRHVGTVMIGPHSTFYDVGEGLILNKAAVAEFKGVQASKGIDPYAWMSRLGTTSPTATALVHLVDVPHPTNSYGFEFRNLSFYADLAEATSLECMIRANDANATTVDNCYADVDGGPMDGFFIICDGEADNSWWTITNNQVKSMGLVQTARPSTNNQNRWNIGYNEVFCSNRNLRGMIDLFNVFDTTIIGNTLEGNMVGCYLGSCGNINAINNSGESSIPGDPFYVMDWGWGNNIVGGRCQISASTEGIFLLNRSGVAPTVMNGLCTKVSELSGSKYRVVDVVDPADWPQVGGTLGGDPAVVIGHRGLEI